MSELSTLHSEQAATAPPTRADGPSIEFFAVGVAINLVLIVAFFVWAYRQGKK